MILIVPYGALTMCYSKIPYRRLINGHKLMFLLFYLVDGPFQVNQFTLKIHFHSNIIGILIL